MTKKPREDIISQHDLTPSSLDKWINQEQSSGSQINNSSLTATLPLRTKQIDVGGISGTTAARPTRIKSDQLYLDATLVATRGKPVFVDASGTGWVDANSTVV